MRYQLNMHKLSALTPYKITAWHLCNSTWDLLVHFSFKIMIADSATLATTPLSPRGVLSDMENGVITMSGVANAW